MIGKHTFAIERGVRNRCISTQYFEVHEQTMKNVAGIGERSPSGAIEFQTRAVLRLCKEPEFWLANFVSVRITTADANAALLFSLWRYSVSR